MRIVSGIYGGRRLESPKDSRIRPTSDKVRGAIFNALLSRGVIDGARVLDLFCGSGGLGLEALSRGALSCIFVDNSRTSLDLAKRNAAALGAEECDFILHNATSVVKGGTSSVDGGRGRHQDKQASLVFMDPPYEKNLVVPALLNLSERVLIQNDGLVVAEVEKGFSEALPTGYQVLDEKVYGDTKVLFLSYLS